jgi:DNA-binding NarL/FixJ family response regulator
MRTIVMSSTVLIVEDDPFTSDWIKRVASERFGDSVRIVLVQSEKEFLIRFPELQEMGLNAAIIDLRLPWEDGGILTDRPELLPPGDASEAGIRVINKLSGAFPQLPILIYSVNDRERLPLPEGPNIGYMRKDEPDERLSDWIGRYCRR